MKIEKETEQMMKKAVEHLAEDYKTLRTNRVNPSMLDSLLVAAYGSEVAIKTLGTISVQERNLMITPFDPNLSGSIVKAINASALKVNATNEGSYIKVPVPPLNEELRKGIAKQAKEKLEDAKISVRKVRQKSKDLAKKQKTDGIITEDDIKNLDKKLQILTDEMCAKLDQLFVQKEKEIMTI